MISARLPAPHAGGGLSFFLNMGLFFSVVPAREILLAQSHAPHSGAGIYFLYEKKANKDSPKAPPSESVLGNGSGESCR